MRHLGLLLATASLLVLAPRAHAGGSDTGDVACGSTPAGWNAPNGALVTNRSPGMIRATLDAVGEYRSHSMLSHGHWVTHSTMHEPGTKDWPSVCSGGPLRPEELRYGYPGLSQTRQGAIYQFLYGGSGVDFIAFQRSRNASGLNAKGAAVADFAWIQMPYRWVTSKQNSGQGFYRISSVNPSYPNPLTYSLYQYRDHWNTNEGWIGHNNGMVCSTAIAYMQYVSGHGKTPAYIYDHAKLVNAGNALYNAIYNNCSTPVLGAIGCFESLCDDAGRQVRNCMSANVCNSDDDKYWNGVKNDTSTVAVSVSPDKIGGWSGHAWSTESESGIWAYDGNQALSWNSGGNNYSCWF